MKDASMVVARIFAMAAVAVTSFPLVAQQASAGVQQSASVQANSGAGSTQVNESSEARASVDMRPVSGELENKLDSKTAKVGDSVVVKTKAAVKTADGTTIPKGTRLVGHVTEVQAHGSGNADSRMAIQFDRAELKGGQSLAIHSMIQSLQPPVDLAASSQSDAGFGGGPISGGGRAGGGGGVRGGGGGLAGGAVGGVANTTAGVGSGVGSAVGGATSAAGNLAGGATADAGSSVHAVTGAGGSVVAQATGVPGVALAGDASGATSGVLFASNKNIHLDSGTQVVLGVAAATSR